MPQITDPALIKELNDMAARQNPVPQSRPSMPASQEESGWTSLARFPDRFATGTAQGAVGDVVGMGQLATDLPAAAGGNQFAAIGRQPYMQGIKHWATDPTDSWATSAGRAFGAGAAGELIPGAWIGRARQLAPWLSRLAQRAGPYLRSAAEGGIVGGIQPTESGDLESHLAGGAFGAGAGAALGRLGNYMRQFNPLRNFNQMVIDYIMEPLGSRANRIYDIGMDGLQEAKRRLDNALSPQGKPYPPKSPMGRAIAEGKRRLDEVTSMPHDRGYFDPHIVNSHYANQSPLPSRNMLWDEAERQVNSGTAPRLPGQTGMRATMGRIGGTVAGAVTGVHGGQHIGGHIGQQIASHAARGHPMPAPRLGPRGQRLIRRPIEAAPSQARASSERGSDGPLPDVGPSTTLRVFPKPGTEDRP